MAVLPVKGPYTRCLKLFAPELWEDRGSIQDQAALVVLQYGIKEGV
jgi:hypothetical protein|tara:strand:- start:136 stop:273 length:138 start_codon:yes stop_codon:yes gene_type:complete